MHDCTNIKPKSGRREGLFISNTMTMREREREREGLKFTEKKA
jgi:hypothetical protein